MEDMTHPTPAVSIVMTAYNHERFIGAAVASCLAQTMADFELIVVNDGSTDGTAAVVQACPDPRVRLLTLENGGPSLALNAGLAVARGTYIALASGDDLNAPTRLERQLAAARGGEFAAIFSHVTYIDEDGAELPLPPEASECFNVPNRSRREIATRFLAAGNMLSAPSAFVPRVLLQAVGGFNPVLFQLQDYEVWVKLLMRGEFLVIPEPLVHYRQHGQNLSRRSLRADLASSNEELVVFTTMVEQLSPAAFHAFFELPVRDAGVPQEPLCALENAFFLKRFQRPVLNLIANQQLARLLATPAGLAAARAHFGYTPHALWHDLQLEFNLPPAGVGNLLERMQQLEDERDHLRAQFAATHAALHAPGMRVMRRLAQVLCGSGLARRGMAGGRAVRQALARMRAKGGSEPGGLAFYAAYAASKYLGRVAPGQVRRWLEFAVGRQAFHPFANAQLASILASNGEAGPAMLLFKRAFLREPSILPLNPPFLDQFVGLLRDAGRTVEQERLFQLVDDLKLSSPAADALFAGAARAAREARRAAERSMRLAPPAFAHAVLRVRPLIPWVEERGGRLERFDQGRTFAFGWPQVWGEPPGSETFQLAVPPSYMATVHGVRVGPAFTLLAEESRELVLYEPAADPRFGQVSGLRGVMRGLPGRPELAELIMAPHRQVQVPEAILLAGRCSLNYFHWLIEYLPKFLEIERAGGLPGVPVLVAGGMPYQHYEVLQVLLGDQRPVIYLDAETTAVVDTLHVPSVSTYIPDDFDSPFWQAGVVSVPHLEFLRARLLPSAASTWQPMPRRIFLSRARNPGRAMANETAVVEACRQAGFTIIYPEIMSAHEQIAAFSQAEVIMGPTGAAFANVIFGRPGTKVYGLTSERNATFCNFANLATSVGCEFTNVTGPNTRPRSAFADEEEFAHSPFSVPMAKIEAILRTLR